MTAKLSAASWMWLMAYAIVMAVLVSALVITRNRVVARLSQPEAQRQWQAWRDEAQRRNEIQGPTSRPVVVSEEPPALVLLRDRFPAIVATSVLIGSFLFAFLMFLARGVARQPAARVQDPDELHP